MEGAELLTLVKTANDNIANVGKAVGDVVTKLNGYDARLSSLETNFKDSLGKRYGENENVPKKQWSWARFAVAAATKDWSYAPFEHEECQRWREKVDKTLTATNFAAGGAWVPEQYVAELITFLRPELVSERVGARMLTGLTGAPVSFPKLSAGASYVWVSPEGTSISPSQQATGRLQLTPHKIAALVKISNDLSMLAVPSIEAAVRADITMALAEGIDKAFFQGVGALGEPRGLANTSGVNTAADSYTGADNVKLNALRSAIKKLASQNALRGRVAWVGNVNSWFAVETLASINEKIPYLQPGAQTEATPRRVLGYPFYFGTQVSPSGTDAVYIGNWDDAMIGMWSTVNVAASDQTSNAFEKDELWIRATAHVDFGFRRPESFVKVNGAVA